MTERTRVPHARPADDRRAPEGTNEEVVDEAARPGWSDVPVRLRIALLLAVLGAVFTVLGPVLGLVSHQPAAGYAAMPLLIGLAVLAPLVALVAVWSGRPVLAAGVLVGSALLAPGRAVVDLQFAGDALLASRPELMVPTSLAPLPAAAGLWVLLAGHLTIAVAGMLTAGRAGAVPGSAYADELDDPVGVLEPRERRYLVGFGFGCGTLAAVTLLFPPFRSSDAFLLTPELFDGPNLVWAGALLIVTAVMLGSVFVGSPAFPVLGKGMAVGLFAAVAGVTVPAIVGGIVVERLDPTAGPYLALASVGLLLAAAYLLPGAPARRARRKERRLGFQERVPTPGPAKPDKSPTGKASSGKASSGKASVGAAKTGKASRGAAVTSKVASNAAASDPATSDESRSDAARSDVARSDVARSDAARSDTARSGVATSGAATAGAAFGMADERLGGPDFQARGLNVVAGVLGVLAGLTALLGALGTQLVVDEGLEEPASFANRQLMPVAALIGLLGLALLVRGWANAIRPAFTVSLASVFLVGAGTLDAALTATAISPQIHAGAGVWFAGVAMLFAAAAAGCAALAGAAEREDVDLTDRGTNFAVVVPAAAAVLLAIGAFGMPAVKATDFVAPGIWSEFRLASWGLLLGLIAVVAVAALAPVSRPARAASLLLGAAALVGVHLLELPLTGARAAHATAGQGTWLSLACMAALAAAALVAVITRPAPAKRG